MPDQLYRVQWPAGKVQLHAASAEQARELTLKYLAQPEAKRIVAELVTAEEIEKTGEIPNAAVS